MIQRANRQYSLKEARLCHRIVRLCTLPLDNNMGIGVGFCLFFTGFKKGKADFYSLTVTNFRTGYVEWDFYQGNHRVQPERPIQHNARRFLYGYHSS